jgi:2-methylisocitrate lyase-like PEP mutase family enzyme
MRSSQGDKALMFRALHTRPARVLAALGFQAHLTSSGASAAVRGCPEGARSRGESLQQLRLIVQAMDPPVAADLENGFGAEPRVVAESVRLAADTGAVGGSLEDASGEPQRAVSRLTQATERITAEAARA